MEETGILLPILQGVVLPIITAVIGWFANVWRNKQKKEKDILTNVQQILTIQKEYIAEQQGTIVETKNMNKRLEAKLDKKNKAIRKANWCKYTNAGDGCPVLNEEEKNDDTIEPVCNACQFKLDENAESKN